MSHSTSEPRYTFAVVSGEARIADLLAEEGVIVEPAFACRFDGFVNDTFTEYRNPSIYRPPSVCRAQLVSTLDWSLRWPGTYYLGFTLYDAAGAEESLEVWLGHRQLTTVRADWHDNRVHLYVITPPVLLKGGETMRLVTAANGSAYRLENLVLLPRQPEPSQRRVEMKFLRAIVQPTPDGHCQAVLTWITNYPAVGEVSTGGRKAQDAAPQPNHRLVLTGLNRNRTYACEVVSRVPGLATARETLSLPTTPPTPQTAAQRESVVLQVGPTPASEGDAETQRRGDTETEGREGREGRGNEATHQPANPPTRQPTNPPGTSVPPVAWPATTGLPFPSGALGDPALVRVLGPDGAEVPCQAEVTARWPDGGVKWLLLTFLTGLTAFPGATSPPRPIGVTLRP